MPESISKLDTMPSEVVTNKSQGGIQSLETGLAVLDVLINQNEPMMLKDIAEAMQINPAKAHRYLVSLIRMHYARQLDDGRYALGSRVTELGHTGLSQNTLLQRLYQLATDIKDVTQCGVQIAKWFSEGPIIIQTVEPDSPISIITRVGSRMPLLGSATGLLYVAMLPESIIRPLVGDKWQALSPQRQQAIEQGYSLVQGEMIQGLNAISLPVLDQTEPKDKHCHDNEASKIEYAVTLIGTSEQLPIDAMPDIAKKIRDIGKQHLLQL